MSGVSRPMTACPGRRLATSSASGLATRSTMSAWAYSASVETTVAPASA